MVKKIVFVFLTGLLFSCKSGVAIDAKKPLVEIITKQSDGGGPIRFYEIISEENEMPMLLGDEQIKKKIKLNAIQTANFVLLNYGETTQKGSTFELREVIETDQKIQLVIDTIEGQEPLDVSKNVFPYWVLKINSKKELILK